MTFPHFVIVSRAHDWAQALPLAADRLTCTRCNVNIAMGNWQAAGECRPHTEHPDSGFHGVRIETVAGRLWREARA